MTTAEKILEHKVIAIVRLEHYDHALEVANALVVGGLSVLEFTLTGRGAMKAISRVRYALGSRAVVGVGSVLHAQEAHAAIQSGAQFVVTPAVRRQVIAACVHHHIPCVCGAFTPTELLTAYEAGSTFQKLFPAQLGGPRYVKDLLAPMPFLKLVPTGGVTRENARTYLHAGAVALGIGSHIISKKAVAAGAFDEITMAAKACVTAVR